MHYNKIERTQFLPISIQEAWTFFSSPDNLAKITPDKMGFYITSPKHEGPMYEGQIITYKVKPLLGIPLNWMTEITKVNPPHHFIDNQLLGPYKLWHHQHHFEEVEGGTMMKDLVHYSIKPFIFAKIADLLFVRKQLNQIFDYREKIVKKIFST